MSVSAEHGGPSESQTSRVSRQGISEAFDDDTRNVNGDAIDKMRDIRINIPTDFILPLFLLNEMFTVNIKLQLALFAMRTGQFHPPWRAFCWNYITSFC